MRRIARGYPSMAILLLLGIVLGARPAAAGNCPNPPSVTVDPSNKCSYYRLSWFSDARATGYKIYKRAYDSSHPNPPMSQWTAVTTVTTTQYDIQATSLPTDYSYMSYKVSALNTNDPTCVDSMSISDHYEVSRPYLPDTPSSVNVSSLAGSLVHVTWNVVPGSVNSVVNIYADGTTPVFSGAPYNAGYKDVTGVCGGNHTYSVENVTADYCVSSRVASTSSVQTTPSAPTLSTPANAAVVTTPDVTLTWAAGTCDGNYGLQIDDNSDFSSPLVSTTTAALSYVWSGAPLGSAFYWRVYSYNSAGNSAWSSPTRYFAHPLVITVGYPNGGETLYSGLVANISWTTSGSAPTVNIDYSTNGGLTWNSIAANTPNTSPYPWTVPNVTTSNALVRVSSGSYSDVSDAPFTIGPNPGGAAVMEWGRDWNLTQGTDTRTALDGYTLVMSYTDSTNGLALAYRSAMCTWSYEQLYSYSNNNRAFSSAIGVGPSHAVGVTYFIDNPLGGFDLRFRRGHFLGGPSAAIANVSSRTSSAVAFDASGTAHIVYSDGTALRYETILPSNALGALMQVSDLMNGQAGVQSCAIRIGPQGPCVAYSITDYYGHQNLGFARLVNGAWVPSQGMYSQTIAYNGGYGVALALDAQGQPRISCTQEAGSRMLYLKWSDATSSWSSTTVTDKSITRNTGLAIDANGLARIAAWQDTYNGSQHAQVPFYVRETTTSPFWESCAIDTAEDFNNPSDISIALQSDGTPLIGYTAPEGQVLLPRYTLEVAQGAEGNPDVTPPSPITDLRPVMGRTTAAPSWTAVGDDGLDGTAANYDVRISRSAINSDADFYRASRVPSFRCPQPAGNGDCESVNGLSPSTRYYFAVKVRDNAGNWSLRSNTATGVTASGGFNATPGSAAAGRGPGMDEVEEVLCEPPNGSHLGPNPNVLPEQLAFAIASGNPLYGPASLRLDIPADDAGSPLSVAVYDAQGRRVRSLVQETAVAGRRTLIWDLQEENGTPVHNGIYFARAHIGSKAIVRTLIVLQ